MGNRVMTNDRIDVYDIAKGIGIILIVIGHLHHFFAGDSDTYIFIYNFHVPLFIFLSGCVMKVEKIGIKEFVSKRFKGIIVPYVVASVLSIVYIASPQNGFSGYFDSILIGSTINGNLSYNVPLWYCTMIFVASVWFYFLYTISSKVKYKEICLIVLTLISTLCGYILVIRGMRFPWNLETGLIAQVYLYIGYRLKDIIKNMYSKKEYIYIVVALLVIGCIYMCTYKLNGRIDMNSGYYNNVFLFAINSILGIAVVLLMSILIRKIPVIWNVLSYLGKNSLYIMVFHRLAASFVQGSIIGYMPQIIRDNLWNANVIGVSYWVVMSILFSLFWGYVYRFCVRTK